jgi:MerR family gold-responsive transcriptional activator of gol and ges genes
MRIREAVEKSGVSAPAIRYYERLGLLGSVQRTPAGYRAFSDNDVQLLVFLRKARDLGFTLSECSELLELVAAPVPPSPARVERTREIASARLADINQQIEHLERRRELVQLHLESLDALGSDCPVTRRLHRQS